MSGFVDQKDVARLVEKASKMASEMVEMASEMVKEKPPVLLIALIAVPILASLVCLICMCRRCRKSKDKTKSKFSAEVIAKEHKKKDKPQYQRATSSSMKLLKELDIGLNQDRVLPSLGSRRRKVWFHLLSSEDYQTYLLSMAEVPNRYSFDDTSCRNHVMEDFSVLRRLSHPNLQPLHALCLCSKKGNVLAGGVIHPDVRGNPPVLEPAEGSAMPPVTEQQVARVEVFYEKGSLKDYIHNVSPTLDKSEKYASKGNPLSPGKVAKLGKQILDAVLYLYSNAPAFMIPLGHIRLQNIYMERKSVCKLGGYENAFLGYGCWLQQQIIAAEHAPSMDIIMFGHVIYYMCTGEDLKTNRLVVVLPEEEHFEAVKDEGCRQILRYIFKLRKNKIKHSMKEIANQSFFAGGVNEPASDSEEEGNKIKARLAKIKQKTKAFFSNDADEAAARDTPKNQGDTPKDKGDTPKNKNRKFFTVRGKKAKED